MPSPYIPTATVIADSITESGHRVTTFEVKHHRFILPELLTHRVASRNGGSSRARPVKNVIDDVRRNLAFPIEFGTNQPGMQAGPPLAGAALDHAMEIWDRAAAAALDVAEELSDPDGLNVHKQVVNRLLEPFAAQTTVLSATEWENFFNQRCTPESGLVPLMQPEFRVAADAIRDAYRGSSPVLLDHGDFHTPYIRPEEYTEFDVTTRCKVSAARCARTSYLTHDGVRDVEKDLELFNDLITAKPPHWSPLEHVCTPDPNNVAWYEVDWDGDGTYERTEVPRVGNLCGYRQMRHSNVRLPRVVLEPGA